MRSSGKRGICLLRWIGILLMIGAGALAGYSESLRLKLRVARLEGFLRFLQAAETEIRFSGEPIGRILEKHGDSFAFLKECRMYMEEGEPFEAAWERSMKKAAASGFSGEDVLRLREFGSGWGVTDTQGQIAPVSYTHLGVDRAVQMVNSLVEEGKSVWTLGPIIHNPQTLRELEQKGVRIADKPGDVPPGDTIVIRSHGVAKAVLDEIREMGLPFADATCPRCV